MTTSLFVVLLMIGSSILFIISTVFLTGMLDDKDTGTAFAAIITAIFIAMYMCFTPSSEQMIENDYYAMMHDRPDCIDAKDVTLGCKLDYVEWQQDSVIKQHDYDSVKAKLEKRIIKRVTITTEVKPDTIVFDTLKTCIDQCWKHILNSDIKKCQDECFIQKGDVK